MTRTAPTEAQIRRAVKGALDGGLQIGADGQTHISAECRDLYDAGHGVLSVAYSKAQSKAQRA